MSGSLKILALGLLLCAAPALAQPDTGTIKTLADAYARAAATSETIAISEQSVKQAEALYRKAFGSSLPEFSLRTQSNWVDHASGQSLTDGMIRLSQSSLNGYRELAIIKQSKYDEGARKYLELRARQLLLGDVAGAFFGLKEAADNVTVLAQLEDFAERRLAELKDRVRVGRAREADAVAQEVQLAGLRSQHEESARLAAAREDLLRYLTRAASVEPQVSEISTMTAEPALASYLAKVEDRPDVGAARDAADSAGAGVRVARADRFPEASLLGDYYAFRPAVRSPQHWDAQLVLSMPFWSWGARQGTDDAAIAFADAAALALQSVRRQADLDVKNAYRDYDSARSQYRIQHHAARLAQRDYDLQRNDERRGLVTSIEVLQSLDRLNSAQLSLQNAVLQMRLTALNLEIAGGAKPEEMDLR